MIMSFWQSIESVSKPKSTADGPVLLMRRIKESPSLNGIELCMWDPIVNCWKDWQTGRVCTAQFTHWAPMPEMPIKITKVPLTAESLRKAGIELVSECNDDLSQKCRCCEQTFIRDNWPHPNLCPTCEAKPELSENYPERCSCADGTNTCAVCPFDQPFYYRQRPPSALERLVTKMCAETPVCQCGGDSVGGTHSSWCQKAGG
jgi:hypothetical protein